MQLPNEAVLLGALRWAHELRDSNERHAFEVLQSAPAYSGLTPTQYMNALRWIKEAGLLANEPLRARFLSSAPECILETAIIRSQPAWLADADITIPSPDELPSDAESAGHVLGIRPAESWRVVQQCHLQVDLEERARVGAVGEAQLMKLLQDAGDGKALHVSVESDAFGYDILWRGTYEERLLEVKTTTRRGRLTIHLSRHEFEVSKRDPRWRLVVLHVDAHDSLAAIATLSRAWLHGHAPVDMSAPEGKWESAAFTPPSHVLRPGIQVTSISGSSAGALLTNGRGEADPPAWWPENCA